MMLTSCCFLMVELSGKNYLSNLRKRQTLVCGTEAEVAGQVNVLFNPDFSSGAENH